jgi:hypothetical protein
VALAASLPLLLRLALIPLLPIPVPAYSDEFSYLLGADTFAHGRLANPQHPLWAFFETYHILVQPTYASMYPPGQALALALGQVLLGRPWWGVFLSVGLMCGAVCWLLQAFLPPRWSLAGGLSFALLFGIEHYFMNSYWGGALATAGGAILLGAASRLLFAKRALRRPRLLGLLVGLGASTLLYTRVWEGFCVALPVAGALAVWIFRARGPEFRARLVNVALPAALPLVVAGAFLLRLDDAVTGNAFEMPYLLNRRTYHVSPLFLWEEEKPTHEYRRELMRRYYADWKVSEEPVRGGPPTRNPLAGLAIWLLRYKLLWGALAAGILTAVFVRRPSARFLLGVGGVFLAGISFQSYRLMHYLAPGMGLCAVALMLGFQTLGLLRLRGRRLGRVLPAIVLAAAAIGFVRNTVLTVVRRERGLGERREQLVAKLSDTPGTHVVLVRYGPAHSVHEEWVYNGADIDNGKVVFACDLGSEDNERLFAYYRDRKIWYFAPDDGDALTPVAIAASRGTAGNRGRAASPGGAD